MGASTGMGIAGAAGILPAWLVYSHNVPDPATAVTFAVAFLVVYCCLALAYARP